MVARMILMLRTGQLLWKRVDANMCIEGTCGGSLSCATCHVVLDADDYVRVGPPSEDEMDMLDLAFNVTETSRLGCQIKMSDELDGLTAKVPEEF